MGHKWHICHLEKGNDLNTWYCKHEHLKSIIACQTMFYILKFIAFQCFFKNSNFIVCVFFSTYICKYMCNKKPIYFKKYSLKYNITYQKKLNVKNYIKWTLNNNNKINATPSSMQLQ